MTRIKQLYKSGFLLALPLFFTIGTSFGQRKAVPSDGIQAPVIDTVKVEQYNLEYLISEGMHFYAIENNAKAMASFQKAHELQKNNAAVNHKLAAIYLEEEQLEKALFHANLSVKKATNNYFYYQLLSDVYTKLGNLEEAIDALEKMFKIADAPDEYLLELAALYLYNSQPDQALATYNRIEKRVGILEEVSTQKQKILLRQNKLKEAIEEGKKLSAARPNIGKHAVSVAQIMISNDRSEEAVEFLSDYVARNPNQPEANLKLAELYKQQGNIEASLANFERAFYSEEISLTAKLNNFVPMLQQMQNASIFILTQNLAKALLELHAEDFKALAAVGDMYFYRQKTDSALKYYEKAIAIDGSNFQVWQNVLSLQLRQKNYKQAIESAEDALTYFPNQPLLYLFLGNAHYALANYDEAIFMMEQGKAMVFGNNELLSSFSGQIANAHHAKKDYQKAFELYEEAIEYNPQNYFAVNNYAYYSALQGKNLERARELAEKLVKANPKSATFMDTYGWVLFQLKDFEKAKSVLEDASKLNPSATILEHYGDALFKVGAKEDALRNWEKAKQKGSKSETLERKINDKKYYAD